MDEENIFNTAQPGAGKENTGAPDNAETKVSGDAGHGNGEDNGKPGHDGKAGSGIDMTNSFKQRIDRMRRRERAKFEQELKSRDEAWEKRIKELEAKIGGSQQPKPLTREMFKSDEEFAAARREAAIDEIIKRMDERNGAKSRQDDEARAKQAEADEAQRKFAVKFQQSMQQNLSREQQQQVLAIVNDEDSAVNSFLSDATGSTLKSWLFEDCTIPADIVLYLEKNADKMELLARLSPRKQLEQLDILERALAKAALEAKKKGQGNPGGTETAPDGNGGRKPPVIGQFGGSGGAVTDFSKLPDTERVARLIKTMRTR